jgi:translocator protein
MHTTGRHLGKLIASIAIAQSAGLIGSLFTLESVATWYPTLTKPSWNPPSWVFGPVWTLLYTMIGVALYLVWTRHIGGHIRILWLRIFGVQLVLNALWSVLFFGARTLDYALIEIAFLWCSILALILLALRFDKRVSLLLIPYLLWVSFASYLNYTLWVLNQ